MTDLDAEIRAAAFSWLDEQRRRFGLTLPYPVLVRGFDYHGHRIPLLGPPGIFKPALLADMPLTIMTAPPKRNRVAPYEDDITAEGLLSYRYQGDNPDRHDNAGLRRAYERSVPLIYLFGVAQSEYEAFYPVRVVGDDRQGMTFLVDLAGAVGASVGEPSASYDVINKGYAARTTLQRLHQRRFRRQVISAYSERCAICKLRHVELLDAAHILPDSDPRSQPVVPNGLALCTLHHPAFDHHLIGIRPDLKVEVRRDVLEEEDGPMLIHGLQGFQGTVIHVPRANALRPDAEFLEERYELFRAAG